MPLQIRRGTNTQRSGIIFAEGEIVYTIDTKKVFIGDGSTIGGVDIAANATLPEQSGNANKFLKTNGAIATWEFPSLISDTNPTLGGNLSLNSHNITGIGDINIIGDIDLTGKVSLDQITLDGNVIKSSNLLGLKITSPHEADEHLIVDGPSTATYGDHIVTLAMQGHGGTQEAPTASGPDEFFGRITFSGRSSTDTYKLGASIMTKFTDDADLDNDTFPPTDVLVITGKGGFNQSVYTFSANGVFYAPKMMVGGYSYTPTLPPQFPGVLWYDNVKKNLMLFDGVESVAMNGTGVEQKTTALTIASAPTIFPNNHIIFVSGTTTIATITPHYPLSVGSGQITLIPTGAWSTSTAGNIALATTAVVNKALIMTYDAGTQLWYPSY